MTILNSMIIEKQEAIRKLQAELIELIRISNMIKNNKEEIKK